MKTILHVAGAALIACVTACGGERNGASGISGVWQRVDGPLWTEQGYGTLRYLELHPDGSGDAVIENGTGGVIGCPSLLFAALSRDVVEIDLNAMEIQQNYSFSVEGNTLTLGDALGQTTRFQRAGSIPAESQCSTLAPAQIITLEHAPDTSSGLAFDGSDLWYTQSNSATLRAVHAGSGIAGAQVDLAYAVGQYAHLRTLQGPDLWLDCGCGHNSDIEHASPDGGTVLDVVTTQSVLPTELVIRDAKWDGDSLWLAGDDYDGVSFLGTEFVDVNSDAEPDLLAQRVPFGSPVESFTFRGAELWAISYAAGPVLVQIQTSGSDWRAIRSIPLPRETWWSAVATGDGGSLYLLGSQYGSTTGTLIRMEVAQ